MPRPIGRLKPSQDNATREEKLKELVATCMFKNYTQVRTALELDIPLWKVNRLCIKIRNEWRANRMRVAEEHFEEQLAKLNEAESAIWEKVMTGYAPAVERWLQLCDQRNKLEGLYAPTKSELDIGEQLANIMTRIADPEPERIVPPVQLFIEGESEEIS